jgi:hypothetical protein
MTRALRWLLDLSAGEEKRLDAKIDKTRISFHLRLIMRQASDLVELDKEYIKAISYPLNDSF